MKFGSPEYFWLLLLLPVVLGFYVYAFYKKKKALKKFVATSMLPKLTHTISSKKQVAKALLIVLTVFFSIIALTRPQYGTKTELLKRKGLDVVIAVDVSLSMYAEDIKPNRLIRAKHEISNFIDKLRGDRIGLVAFAGEAFVQCPLTLDYSAAKIFLNVLGPDLISTPGTAIGPAIETALSAFNSKEEQYRVIVLLTDGEGHTGTAETWAEEAAKKGVIVYTVGIGSLSGVPIPLKDKQGNVTYKKDLQGNVVSTKLDEATLVQMAEVTGGTYFHAAPGQFELEQVVQEIESMEKRELEEERFTQHKEQFQWPLALAIICLLLEFLISDRRKNKTEWKGRFQ
jgi:Ca-activated chloride channel family protein